MKRKLGTSNIEVSPITMGAWAIGGFLWGGNDEKDSIDAIHAYIDNGVTTIDTAPVYGQGYSEQLIGKAIKGYDRSKIQILTKFGMVWDMEKGDFAFEAPDNNGTVKKFYRYGGYDTALRDVETSLKNLNTDYIDLIQLHWPDTTTPIEETMRAMEKMLQDGKVRAVGVCNYNAIQMKEAAQTLHLHSNQVPYSMLKRDIETDVVPYAIDNNIAVIAYSPIERGLLSGKYNSKVSFESGDHRNNYVKKFDMTKVTELTGKLGNLAKKYNATTTQMVLAWTIQQPGITAALAGARNAQQATENAKALGVTVSSEDLQLINSWLEDKFLL